MDCVEVCPVDCFFEGSNMLVIDPDVCIDCGVCELECPVNAIIPESNENGLKWLSINREFSKKWPNITKKGLPPKDADEWASVEDKYKNHFSPDPGISKK